MNLPGEIVDSIIDLLHDDLHALEACSLTCQEWTPRARFNLFKKLKVNLTNKSLPPGEELVLLRESSVPFSAVQIMQIYNGELILDNVGLECWPRFTVLDRLHLDCITFSVGELLPPFVQKFPSLRSLHLQSCHFPNPRATLRLIGEVTYLVELRFTDVAWNSFVEIPPENFEFTPTPTPIGLRHLTLDRVANLDEFIALLLMMYPNLSLWSLWTSNTYMDNILMEQCSHSLKMLDLRHEGAVFFRIMNSVIECHNECQMFHPSILSRTPACKPC